MHESSLVADLVAKATAAAAGLPVAEVRVRVGALSAVSPGHLRDHLLLALAGTALERAVVVAARDGDVAAPHAQDVLLEAVVTRAG